MTHACRMQTITEVLPGFAFGEGLKKIACLNIDVAAKGGKLLEVGFKSGPSRKDEGQAKSIRLLTDVPDEPFKGSEEQFFSLVDNEHGFQFLSTTFFEKVTQFVQKISRLVLDRGIHAQIETGNPQQIIEGSGRIIYVDHLVFRWQTVNDDTTHQRLPGSFTADQFDEGSSRENIQDERLTDFLPSCPWKKNIRIRLFPERGMGEMKVFKVHTDDQSSVKKHNSGEGERNFDMIYICTRLGGALTKDTLKKWYLTHSIGRIYS